MAEKKEEKKPIPEALDIEKASAAEMGKAYLALADIFNSKHDDKDEDVKSELRKIAQRMFTYANCIRQHYQAILDANIIPTAEDVRDAEGEVKYWTNQITFLTAWLKRCGSPMSGIPKTTFADVAGLEEVKTKIQDYLFMINNPAVAKAYRIDTNIGILLYGPPGTGKTLIAEAIANALNVRYFVITPTDIFSKYVGESEKNVKDIFAEMNECLDGCVLLIDECESIFARRTGEGDRASTGVANQLLQEMNGQGDKFSRRVIIGATNRPELMDEAYLRYKRFSLQFYIGMPNNEAKEAAVELNLKGRPYEDSFKEAFLLTLYGESLYTCADIAGIIEQCAYLAMQECRRMHEDNPMLRFGDNEPFVKMNTSHLESVLATYPHSVTQEMLDQYESFRDGRINGK
ncbi:MAG: ATP-binding protein [Clostridia bacterium]|nr:ATP-binding protein [Clostridia bacterium]